MLRRLGKQCFDELEAERQRRADQLDVFIGFINRRAGRQRVADLVDSVPLERAACAEQASRQSNYEIFASKYCQVISGMSFPFRS